MMASSMPSSKLSFRQNDSPRILVVYTGGTIGMMQDPERGYVVKENYFVSSLKKLPMFYDKEFVEQTQTLTAEDTLPSAYKEFPELVMPLSNQGKRIFYHIKEQDTIIDSSNMSMGDWTVIAKDIEKYYKDFDAFIILHGTDTLAYSASALAFMMEGLGKTVILTGAQIPIFEQRNDARSNFIGALVIAGHYIIPEVTIYFSNKLLRGCRSSKTSTSDLDAFTSPNLPPLLNMGVDIDVKWDSIFRSKDAAKFGFRVSDKMDVNVGVLRLTPGINAEIVSSFLRPPMKGAVVETFGAGNVPSNRPDLLAAFKAASERGVILLNITQCLKGSVTDAYEAGKAFAEIGVLSGCDMTTEAALTKLAYVIAKDHFSLDEKKELVMSNLRGEMTVPHEQQFRLKEGKFVRTVATSLKVGSEKEMENLRRALLPIFLCCAAKSGDTVALDELLSQGADVNNPSDYDGKSCLHIACAEGRVEMVEHLLEIGASVYVKDRRGRVPLFDAVRNKNEKVIDVLLKGGAHFLPDDREVARELCIAACNNDIARLKLFKKANVDLNWSDMDGRTPLHFAVMRGNLDAARYLIKDAGVDVEKEDIFGNTPLSNARKLHFQDVIDVIVEAEGFKARELSETVLLNDRSQDSMLLQDIGHAETVRNDS